MPDQRAKTLPEANIQWNDIVNSDNCNHCFYTPN